MHRSRKCINRRLPLDFGFEDVLTVCSGGIVGHRQITDAWLVAAAVHHDHKLLTWDAGIAQLFAGEAERDRHIELMRPTRRG